MREKFVISILGLSKLEQILVLLFSDLHINEIGGEIPGRNIRNLFNINKDELFFLLEKLSKRRILKLSKECQQKNVYIKAGNKGYYIYNDNYNEWIPSSNSLFYTLCKLLKLKPTKLVYNNIIEKFYIKDKLFTKKEKVEYNRITPYEVYECFCNIYKKTFKHGYKSPNLNKDFKTVKNILFTFNFNNIKDRYVKEFLNWTFLVKARSNKSDFIIGFLPLYLKDYLKNNKVEKENQEYYKDEDGRLRRK